MGYRCRELDNVYTINEFSTVLCYPSRELTCAIRRCVELGLLGIHTLCFGGGSEVYGKRIVGKGTTALVVKGFLRDEPVAVKIRRIDANRFSLLHEAKILEKIKGTNIGPELLASSRNFLVWRFIEGLDFADWLQGINSREELQETFHRILYKLYLLDTIGIAHNELSRPFNHVIIDPRKREPYIIDFESASVSSRRSNLAQFMGYFLGEWSHLPEKLSKNLMLDSSKIQKIRFLLRVYKNEREIRLVEEINEVLFS